MSPEVEELKSLEHTTQEEHVINTWEHISISRILEFKYLIRKFEIQLRYGCINPSCSNSNCLTFQSNPRHTQRTSPHRRPSPLTARIMAFYLASDSDPYTKLCSNQPCILPQQLDMSAQCVKIVVKQKRPAKVDLYSSNTQSYNKKSVLDYWRSNLSITPGATADRKSIIQNLFHSSAVRSFLWQTTTTEPTICHEVLSLPCDITIGDMEVRSRSEQRQSNSIRDSESDHQSHPSSGLQVKADGGSVAYTAHLTIRDLNALRLHYLELSTRQDRKEVSYLKNTLYHALGTPQGLIESFRNCLTTEALNHDDFLIYMEAFHWNDENNAGIFGHLSRAIDALFVPPSDWKVDQTLFAASLVYVNDNDAGHMLSVCWLALIAWVYQSMINVHPRGYLMISKAISEGCMYEDRFLKDDDSTGDDEPGQPNETIPVRKVMPGLVEAFDAYGSEPAKALASKLLQATSARTAFSEAQSRSAQHKTNPDRPSRVLSQVMTILKMFNTSAMKEERGPDLIAIVVDWLVSVTKETWNGKLTLNRWSPAGASIEMLQLMAREFDCLGEGRLLFIDERLHDYTAEWLLKYAETFGTDVNMLHLASLPALFPLKRQVKNFRALNYARMCAAYKEGIYTSSLKERLFPAPDQQRHEYLEERLTKATARYLVLNVRRDLLLEDSLDQLWRRERRELIRPLKVRMGMELGEAGVDQGGVSQEFFRLAFRKAFDLDSGIFVKTDENSSCFWPHPDAHEPSSTYQLLGLLTALGVYNGLVLPLSLPQVWYASLALGDLGQWTDLEHSSIHHGIDRIKDAWPTLHRSFMQLLSYESARVEEDLGLDWTYSYESHGYRHHIDMWASKDTGDEHDRLQRIEVGEKGTMPVTGSNRLEYIANYLRWMCKETVYEQLDAFSRGFKTVICDATLSVLEPRNIQRIVEGNSNIDIELLQKSVRYEGGFDDKHQVIQWFWQIVSKYSPERHKALLNFVTAVDRAPVNGIESILFVVQRQGNDSELLPTSSTCFGKLLLPEYSSKEKLKKKLDVALDNCNGFGTA